MVTIPGTPKDAHNALPMAREVGNDEFRAVDVADEIRRAGGTPGDLNQSMTELGYGPKEKLNAITHLVHPCSHEALADIGTLPTYPERRVGLDGSESCDIRATANASWKAIEKAND